MKSLYTNILSSVVLSIFIWLCSNCSAQKPLKADFKANDVCNGDTTSFVNLSKYADSLQPIEFSWRFGDGAKSSDYHPKHLYKLQNPGETESFNTILIIRSKSHPEFLDSIARSITVNAASDPHFSLLYSYHKGNNVFSISQQNTKDPLNTYIWNFFDLYKSNAVTPVFTLKNGEPLPNFTVSLIIINHAGCFSSSSVDWFIDIPGSVSERELNDKTMLYPNPSNGRIKFTKDVKSVAFYDMVGDLVLSIEDPSETVTINLSSGQYLAVISAFEGTYRQKLFVQ